MLGFKSIYLTRIDIPDTILENVWLKKHREAQKTLFKSLQNGVKGRYFMVQTRKCSLHLSGDLINMPVLKCLSSKMKEFEISGWLDFSGRYIKHGRSSIIKLGVSAQIRIDKEMLVASQSVVKVFTSSQTAKNALRRTNIKRTGN